MTDFAKSLTAAGLRPTKARLALLETLERAEVPQRADDLQRQVALPQSTVYRALAELEERGLLERLYDDCGECGRYALTGRAPCCILRCVRCDNTEAVHLSGLHEEMERACERMGFASVAHRVELLGICAKCRAKQPTGHA